jgi:hypothetical protein
MTDATRTTIPRIPRPGALIASIELDENDEKSYWLEEYSHGSDARPGVNREVVDICPAVEDATDDDCLIWADQVASAAGYLIMGYEKVSETSWVLTGPAHTRTRLVVTGDLIGEIAVVDVTKITETETGQVPLGTIVTDLPLVGEAEMIDLIAQRLEGHGYHPIGYRPTHTPTQSMWELVEYRDDHTPNHTSGKPIPYPGVRTSVGRRAVLRRIPWGRGLIDVAAIAFAFYLATTGDRIMSLMALGILALTGADLWITIFEIRRSWVCPKCRENGLRFTAYSQLGGAAQLGKVIRHHYQTMHPTRYTGRR